MSKDSSKFLLYNMCFAEAPSIEEIVLAISDITHVPASKLIIPGYLLKCGAKQMKYIFALVGENNGIHPERVEKLMRSTNISGAKLENSPFAPRFTLRSSIEDWYNDCGHKGLY